MPRTILSENSKCGCSINLPIRGHCTPTKNCSRCCYARMGHTALPVSKAKQTWVSNYLQSGNDHSRLILEAKAHTSVRLCGTGDLLQSHIPALFELAETCKTTQFWGMTRKINIATQVNGQFPNLHLLVSVDASSPKSVWNYQGALCWGPRLPADVIPVDDRIKVVFPYHAHGRVIQAVPKHPKDCQAVWHNISGCLECGRCWNW